jgi:hypothetical protein
MAKQSPARTKMLASQAKKAAAERRAQKAVSNSAPTASEADNDKYSELEGEWIAIGLAVPARRALIDDGLFTVSDLRKTSLAALKELHGMGPNAIRVLVAEMKKADLSFRK